MWKGKNSPKTPTIVLKKFEGIAGTVYGEKEGKFFHSRNNGRNI